ncbi:nuclear transport factor 2 family protein [Actinomadura barringtoniae]|uniref:Nuclear transport factor 2 family protein n=1 Tax=Actinomadura barringtoniae TaxID=1427535 RepID=A0A939T8K5_9ACTN|nr:nuclear transport factor 2 family protein [Actinomadura barringtoniae]MBO2454238.1 nuclear transport factor 2 family protein [Actinomadura barringtoniae]
MNWIHRNNRMEKLMETRTDAEKVVRRYFDALANGKDEIVRDSFAEDATWWYAGELPMSGTWNGREQIVDGFLGSAYDLLDPDKEVGIEVTEVIATGDHVIVEWTSSATVKNGNPYLNHNIGVFVVRDGRIAVAREYADTQHWEHALRAPQA